MSAIFSECGTWRYRLDRQINMLGAFPVTFCLHNPSTADAEIDDPTLRRCIGFATAWNASRLTIVNAWAAVATDPADLWRMQDPVGPDNDQHIAAVATEAASGGGFVVLAWGAVSSPPASMRGAAFNRLDRVESLIFATGAPLRTFGYLTKDGSPRHPLYLPAGAGLTEWQGRTRMSAERTL